MSTKTKRVYTTFDVLLLSSGILFGFTMIAFLFLSTPTSSALNTSIDNITIIVPASCSLSGTNTEHAATINNGTYNSNVGLTTMKAFCNDHEGFAIYAIGYTNEQDGNTVLTNGVAADNIVTGTATSGNASNWAMKLATPSDPAPAYPITLSSDTSGSFGNYHVVPSTFTEVAYRASGTDVGAGATGATLTSTYQVYISATQPAGTYTGKVKYLLVHPASISSVSTTAITIDFVVPSGSNMSFAGGATTNTVKYRQVCTDPNDSDTCKFIATEGEYQQPTGYKGAWSVPLLEGTLVYPISVAEQWADGFDLAGGASYLGATLTVTADNADAIFYDGNGATSGSMDNVASRFNMVADGVMEAPSPSSTTMLVAPNFKKEGYGFAGWSTSNNATPGGASTIYGPNQTVNRTDFTFDQNGATTLYAVWVQSTGTMQNFSCNSLASGAVTALTDIRDGNTYAVSKLADGNCWMMENLRLDSSANLNSTNTNNPVISNLTVSSNDWCATLDATCVNQSKLNTNNTNIGGANSVGQPLMPVPMVWVSTYQGVSTKSYWYSYGNYYNWYAATAGNGTYSTSTGNVAGDVCPSGWSLPTGRSGGEFSALDVAMGGTGTNQDSVEASNRWRTYPKNFVCSGGILFGGFSDRSLRGSYWARSATDSPYASKLSIGGGYVNPDTFVMEKNGGSSIRCLTSGV